MRDHCIKYLYITGFAEHVIKCAKKRRKKSIKSQRRIRRNGAITPKTPVKAEQKSPANQTLHYHHSLQNKLSSPLKQEIRTMYRLNVTKHDTDCETDSSDGNQSPQKKLMASPIATSSPSVTSTVQGEGSNCVRRKLTYLSEKQSGMSPMIGAPNPPPCTPDDTGLNNTIITIYVYHVYYRVEEVLCAILTRY